MNDKYRAMNRAGQRVCIKRAGHVRRAPSLYVRAYGRAPTSTVGYRALEEAKVVPIHQHAAAVLVSELERGDSVARSRHGDFYLAAHHTPASPLRNVQRQRGNKIRNASVVQDKRLLNTNLTIRIEMH